MERRKLEELLSQVADGSMSVQDATRQLAVEPYADLGFAKVDHHRGIRQGVSEVIYGAGKTPDQIAGIIASMLDAGQERVLITRLQPEVALEVEQLLYAGLTCVSEDAPESASGTGCAREAVSEGVSDAGCIREYVSSARFAIADGAAGEEALETDAQVPELPIFTYYDIARLATVGEAPEPDGEGDVVVACGGTSDIYAAEEAALTAEMLGNRVVRLYDVGVAGLHRLLAHYDELSAARVIVAVAGMEGALASVVGGLVSCPVIAVPTSVGYGASFEGVAALLAMLNSCASGVSVVNIDNGFGAGYLASLINHL